MTLKLFDSRVWAPQNIIAFYKNLVDALNKGCFLVCRYLIIVLYRLMAPNNIEAFQKDEYDMNGNISLKLFDSRVWVPQNIVAFLKTVVDAII